MHFYDISLPLENTLATWPGDTRYRYELSWQMERGNTVNVGTITLSVHAGTHIDAPYHFQAGGKGAAELDITIFIGPAIVADVRGAETITWDHLKNLPFDQAPRLLLRTDAWSDHTIFPTQIPTLAPDVPARLGERGVVLLGVDVPSVDDIESKALPNHHALTAANIRILESLDLRDVPTDIYTLSALPLRLVGADGAPVRAVLWR